MRILFVDFSSAFNTTIPSLLQSKLTQLSIPTFVCQWITSFLTDRQQVVRLGKFSSSTHTISTGAPQGCVFSPHQLMCRPLHINNCLVQLSYQIWPKKTTEGSPDCWADPKPPHSPRTVLIQSEQKGWQNHSGPLTSSKSLQSSEHQNGQTQEVSSLNQSISWTVTLDNNYGVFIHLYTYLSNTHT